MSVYYNEWDQPTAAWLRELMKANLIPQGDVDERSITEVTAEDVRGYTQAHFFAGIGGWAYALRLAGWPAQRAVWTGSCPCQPFSAAGKGASADDPRHLWPAWFRLIQECGPECIFGEQVASLDGLAWLDLVHTDMEAAGYALGAVDLGAASVGAPHRRQRVFFVADTSSTRRQQITRGPSCDEGAYGRQSHSDHIVTGDVESSYRRMADTEHAERRALDVAREDGRHGANTRWPEAHSEPGTCGEVRSVADSDGSRRGAGRAKQARDWRDAARVQPTRLRDVGDVADPDGRQSWDGDVQPGGEHGQRPAHGAVSWEDAEWIACTDGKARPVEPGTFPLAYGVPARVGRLRGYGNAIVPQVAQVFIEAYLDTEG